MKSGKLKKMTTILAVLFLVMSGLMVVQWNAQPVEATQHEDYTSTIWGIINPDGDVDSNLDIKLKSLSTGEIVEEKKTNENYYEFTNVKPGWYEVILPSQVSQGTAYMRGGTDSDTPIHITNQTEKRNFNVGTKTIDHTIEVNVTYQGEAVDVDDVTVTLEDKVQGFMHEASLVNEENATFEADIYSDFNGSLKVTKEEYAPYFNSSIELNGDTTRLNVSLSKGPWVSGYLTSNGNPRDEIMDITLYNETIGILSRTREGPYFKVRAPPGDYTLIIDLHGYKPLNYAISLDQNHNETLGELDVNKSESEVFQTDIEFDYNKETGEENLTVMSYRSIRAGTRMETVDHPFIGNLAMQIDLALGNGDLNLTPTEVGHFKDRLNYTKNITYTPEFITVNESVFKLKDYTAEFSEGFEDNLTGNVTHIFDGEMYFNTTRIYEPVEIGPGRHIIDLTVDHDRMYGNKRDYTYTVDLREEYERYVGSDSEQVIPDNVEVNNYTKLEINPMENGLTSDLTFDVRKSDEGEVELNIANEAWIHEFEDEEEYVIREGTEAELMANHQNPTSIALEYNWSLIDDEGNPAFIGEGEEITHTFNDSGTLKVEITESSGAKVNDTVNITVDGEGPEGDILVNEEGYFQGETVKVNETEEIEFSGWNLSDNATGIVDQYKWTFNFSDGDETQDEGMNITHTFEIPGEYNVTLNVTDGVGNTAEKSINVTVRDITKPTVVIRTEWNGENSTELEVSDEDLIIGTNVTFNATESVAHEKYEGELENITWWIEELEMKNKGNFSENQILENISFEEEGDYTVWANVTDVSGNYKNKSVTVNIRRGPTPDLIVSDFRFSKDNIRAGDTVTISVNVTNVEDVNATDITTVLRVDGEEIKRFEPKLIKDGEELDRKYIKPNEEVRIDIKWEPESDGEMTVNVNVTAGDERDHSDLLWDNDKEQTINVDPPVWREYIVYALIPIIIIGVTVGLYLFKDRLSEMLR